MIRLILMLVMLPMLACSQNDLGFWEGTPEKLDGCKMFEIVKGVSSPPLPIVVTTIDCYGNERRLNIGVADGATAWVCSMTTPSNSPLISSITQTGWCTNPLGNIRVFWWEPHYGTYDDINAISIYSSDAGGANRNLLFQTSNPSSISGEGNAAEIIDSYPSQEYYVVVVTGRKSGSVNTVYVQPGYSYSIQFRENYFETKEMVFAKRDFYLASY